MTACRFNLAIKWDEGSRKQLANFYAKHVIRAGIHHEIGENKLLGLKVFEK